MENLENKAIANKIITLMSIMELGSAIFSFKDKSFILGSGYLMTSAGMGFESFYYYKNSRFHRRGFFAAAVGCFISAGDKAMTYKSSDKEYLRNSAFCDLILGGLMGVNHYIATRDYYNRLNKDKEKLKENFSR
jgi:hypothetical protein